MTKVQKIKVLKEDQDRRLDQYLKKKFPGLPHVMIEKWCRKGNVRIDGKRVKARVLLRAGQEIRLPPLPPLESPPQNTYVLTQEDRALIKESLLFEDDFLIVLNKPAGLAVQGGTGTYRHMDALLTYFQGEKGEKPHLVHRLDRDTSGLLVVAKTHQAAQWLTQAFKEKTIQKTYLALVIGVPSSPFQTITLPLEKMKGDFKEKMGVTPTGKPAITHLRVLRPGKGISFVQLIPETGRTHQLRVHCQAIQHPILGDKKYGGKKAQPFRRPVKMSLHAYSLDIPYPNEERKRFTAPLPQAFRSLMIEAGLEDVDPVTLEPTFVE